MKEVKKVKVVDRYLSRQTLKKLDQVRDDRCGLVIVIPCYNEENLFDTLNSIEACDPIPVNFEVIVVLNASEETSEHIVSLHRRQREEIKAAVYSFHLSSILIEGIPSKTAGVGYARKTGMDLALARLQASSNLDGPIVCLDGDCVVSTNYLIELHKHFKSADASQAVHLRYEHILPEHQREKEAIVLYESHLRLMKLFLQDCGHPQAFHAVGSCLAVRAWAYASQGGMNSRQAGEDFYFIHKYSNIGQLSELNSAIVYPSARSSDRVPFGTGAAIVKRLNGEKQLTYNPKSYEALKNICLTIPELYDKDVDIELIFHQFKMSEIKKRIQEARKNSTSRSLFTKRFFQFFDAFQVIKFLHHLRDQGNQDVEIATAFDALNKIIQLGAYEDMTANLKALRTYEATHQNPNN